MAKPQCSGTSDKLLTPAVLRQDFGSRAVVTRDAVRVFHDALVLAGRPAVERWKTLFGRWAGRAFEKIPNELAKVSRRYGIGQTAGAPEALLLALQTYYALLVTLVARRHGQGRIDELLPDNPFSWYASTGSERVDRLIERLTDALADYQPSRPPSTDDSDGDLFKPLYQDLFPRSLRHQLGEYYTPDWLARHVLDQAGYEGQPGQRLLDPACGSGTFLVMALRRWRRQQEREERRQKGDERKEEGERHVSRNSVRATLEHSVGAAVELPHQPNELPHQLGSALEAPPSSLPSPLSPLFPVVGFDLNPLAVLTARANYLIAVADLLPATGAVEIPVYLCDSILGVPTPACGADPFDYVVGNPPWIAWDNLPADVREATKPLWERYGLFSLSGNEARHGGGKKDLSMLMLYATADRYLEPGGRLSMVITQTLFQTKGAGAGFRRFRLGPDGTPLKVLRVDDLVALRPFDDAANWTSTIVLEKGTATEYPVPYVKWNERKNGECEITNDECSANAAIGKSGPSVHHSTLINHHFCHARPIDPACPTSPWLVVPDGAFPLPRSGKSDYTAHLGANSGGANGVYWVEVMNAAEGGVLVRNIAARGKHAVETVEQVIEPDLLCPLVRWSDVQRYSAVPHSHILLVQDPATRAGIGEDVMRQRYPRTLAYLEQFRCLLTARAAYRRYQQRGPFYAMYNVGPYTVAPAKVVWRRMDRRINAAVIEEIDDPVLGRRPVVPQETCVLVACESADEAHYVCAVLNSAVVNDLVSAHSVRGGKGFGTPGMLEYVPLRRYQTNDPRHAALAALSRKAHGALLLRSQSDCRDETLRASTGTLAEIQRQIDQVAADLWATSTAQSASI